MRHVMGRNVGLVWFVLWAGCGVSSSSGLRLDGRAFLLQSADGFTPVEGTVIRLTFEDGGLRFTTGCNQHSGNYALRDGHLVIDNLNSTDIACDEELAAQEAWLAAFFFADPLLSLAGEQLTLTGHGATLMFLDREVADPDRPLVGTVWIVDTLIDGDGASNVPLDPQPTVDFNPDGTLHVDTTCNSGDGDYEVRGDTLVLSGIAYTEAGCPTQTAQHVEAHIQNVLRDGTVMFAIEAARLSLDRGDQGLRALAPTE